MKITKDLYHSSLTLLTDYYQFTMAYAYWKAGKAEEEAIFNLFFRKNPFQSGFTIAAGLDYIIDYCRNMTFGDNDLAFLAEMKDEKGQKVFESGFIDYLKNMTFSCDIDAVEEGEVVFPNMPMVRVKGPLIQCQLLETPLLNIINFQTLIATKAARMVLAANGDPVMEFGLRRAQGIDGALAASRASYIGGCSSTSNVMAAKLFGIPVSGTHAHSWIMSFENELTAFESYAETFPDNTILLVDTYDIVQGVKHAIEVAGKLKDIGKELKGIRIDSGDLAYFSNLARNMLNEAGFPEVKIVASNDLDEHIITSLKMQEASIDVWGVGTKLVTAYDQPALGAVYKLSALKSKNGDWVPKIKLSQQSIKINIPGHHNVLRYSANGKAIADMIYLEGLEQGDKVTIIDPIDPTRRKKISVGNAEAEVLLKPIFVNGKKVYERPSIQQIRQRTQDRLAIFDKTHKRLINPHIYPVGLEASLHEFRTALVLKAKSMDNGS
ncbi:nicotinate phosphoribosyltransferase [Cyclobacterium marinum]|uniref:Nicotinate phosphoribosyltransferase n=1 Tax=Cyclobacterium marinum (strain ATCC 25205 / DSM 745 / LMG 13164 / NCIMB 1802) TaxID=880070 RepID=G0J6Q6_CYCMS|nr:nicotinate phosphoribosyltransferase [Cyclobacterium marinum]AEL28571.1 nicotinate phosphoribosyltransferase [Cyclobacterium marinum DSM 745]MBI0398417.1 nicotinate phosphoribosyltransferase [Cyclobacterium marinum]MBR9776090.1 nicotinate phosphoribosyltransferase [Cytophagales bacterium]|tara:strand:+ start:76916 stop:78397 length:1482 start_codon:yes stop_codon:yes gene_type:complete